VLGALFVLRQTGSPSDDAGRHVQAADLRALDLDRQLHLHRPGPGLRQPALLLPSVLGKSATDTGILLTAWPLALASIAPIAGRLADRYHAGFLGAIGLTSMTTGLVLTALLPPIPRPPTSCGGWCCAARASASSPRPTTG
jgi:DHA2 family multidrug resistance protein-like MFS transporter